MCDLGATDDAGEEGPIRGVAGRKILRSEEVERAADIVSRVPWLSRMAPNSALRGRRVAL